MKKKDTNYKSTKVPIGIFQAVEGLHTIKKGQLQQTVEKKSIDKIIAQRQWVH